MAQTFNPHPSLLPSAASQTCLQNTVFTPFVPSEANRFDEQKWREWQSRKGSTKPKNTDDTAQIRSQKLPGHDVNLGLQQQAGL